MWWDLFGLYQMCNLHTILKDNSTQRLLSYQVTKACMIVVKSLCSSSTEYTHLIKSWSRQKALLTEAASWDFWSSFKSRRTLQVSFQTQCNPIQHQYCVYLEASIGLPLCADSGPSSLSLYPQYLLPSEIQWYRKVQLSVTYCIYWWYLIPNPCLYPVVWCKC